MNSNDAIWRMFESLWRDLPTNPLQIVIAGGYGLFLKQEWLQTQPSPPILIPLEQWPNQTPRSTKDIDLVLSLDILSSVDANKNIVAALNKHNFQVVERNARWQFERFLDGNQTLLLDLHAEMPTPAQADLMTDKRIRVKHKNSLGVDGIHGRQNPEAAGADLHPFQFEHRNTTLAVPNPVTWAVMKIVATKDRIEKASHATQAASYRENARLQAEKHAQDVARIIAMMTRDERDQSSGIVAHLQKMPSHQDICQIANEHFIKPEGLGHQFIGRSWDIPEQQLIQQILAEWFR